jgi:hypothetical protein
VQSLIAEYVALCPYDLPADGPLFVGDAQPFPESERQKAEEARKKTDEKATDEAYKSLMKHLPATNKKVDPWGGLRAPSATLGK